MIRSCPDKTSQGIASQRVEEPDEGQAAGGDAEATPSAGSESGQGFEGDAGVASTVESTKGRGLGRSSSRGSWIAGAMVAKRWQLLGLNGDGQGQE